MYLGLLRHGEAEAFSASGQDSTRRLTQRGFLDIQRSAKHIHDFIAQRGGRSLAIVHSPFSRAKQSAEAVAKQIQSTNNMVVAGMGAESQITPDVAPEEALATLRVHVDAASNTADMLLVVTHQPLISKLASGYLDGVFARERGGRSHLTPALQPASLVILGGQFLDMGCCELITQCHPYNDGR